MKDKTPKFDKMINDLLFDARAGEMICQATDKKFTLRPEDIEFYKLLNVPLPVFCPEERAFRVIAHTPSREFFLRKSDLSGKETVSNIDPESPLKIYDNSEWWSDEFDASAYGREYRSEESFFDQWHELQLAVPRPAIYSLKGPLGNNMFSQVLESNNCYRSIGGPNLENVYFSNSSMDCRDCAELFTCKNCELCYQLFECVRCYNSTFLDSCSDCTDCNFGHDLEHCSYCFGCNNLRYKKFCFFNKQLTEEEYNTKMSEINLGSRQEQDSWLGLWEKERFNAYRLNLCIKNSENCFGNNLFNCKNCFSCVEAIMSRDVGYSFHTNESIYVSDSYDAFWSERICNSRIVLNSYDVYFSYDIFYSSQVEYSEFCHHVENCFGCVGLRNKKFHIFNKPYSETEYWKKVDEIKCAMLVRGEYGSAMPLKYTAYAYNLCIVNDLFPLTREEAKEKGIHWHELPLAVMPEALHEVDIPDDIQEIKDDIIGRPIACRESGRLYSIVKSELDFYRRINVPIPTEHHWQRWAAKCFRDQSIIFVKDSCQNCSKEIKVQNFKNKKEKVTCKECYDKLVEKY